MEAISSRSSAAHRIFFIDGESGEASIGAAISHVRASIHFVSHTKIVLPMREVTPKGCPTCPLRAQPGCRS